MDSETNIEDLKQLLRELRDERDWLQFHDPKNMAVTISIEAGELLEHFQWKTKEEVTRKMENDPAYRAKVEDELADVFNNCLVFANATGIDLASISRAKIERIKEKYPVEKARGNSIKYTEL